MGFGRDSGFIAFIAGRPVSLPRGCGRAQGNETRRLHAAQHGARVRRFRRPGNADDLSPFSALPWTRRRPSLPDGSFFRCPKARWVIHYAVVRPDRISVAIFGASARAAAFSALRAGLRAWCADLFGDLDLRIRGAAEIIPTADYPRSLIPVAERAPVGPWFYTGGFENHASLIQRLARRRPLWGNDAEVLAVVRSPRAVAALLEAAGIECPAVRFRAADLPPRGRWLVKPVKGAGGAGVGYWNAEHGLRRRGVYFQEQVAGDSCAAVYVGDGKCSRLLGVTRQLVGEAWLHAGTFGYCGSVGPLPLAADLERSLRRLGEVLVAGSGMRGLFGVDFILRNGVPWPVEINPRYTASVEVLEFAWNFPLLALHRRVFDASAEEPPELRTDGANLIGKAVLFAGRPLCFPADGPWQADLDPRRPVTQLPAFADIPPAGQSIARGRPILTFFRRGASLEDCLDGLRRTARDLDRRLFGQ